MAKISYADAATSQVAVERPSTLWECADMSERRIVRIGHAEKALTLSYSYIDRSNGQIAWTLPLTLSIAEAKKALQRKTLGTTDVGSLTSAFKLDNRTFYGFSARKACCAFAFTVDGQRPLQKDEKGNLSYGVAPIRVRLYVNAVDVGKALDKLDLLSTSKPRTSKPSEESKIE